MNVEPRLKEDADRHRQTQTDNEKMAESGGSPRARFREASFTVVEAGSTSAAGLYGPRTETKTGW
jgi:hypothetical protein